jgi:Family of unknown function (DUF5677)
MESNRREAHAQVVEVVARRLDELRASLSPGSSVLPEEIAPWSLLQRAGSLFDGIEWLLQGPSEASIWIVARSLADLAVTVPWLRIDPDTHLKLWTAEECRRQLELLPELEGRTGTDEPGREALERSTAWRRSIVAQARQLARDKDIPGMRKGGSLVPSLRARADAVGTDATRDAYSLFFGPWSEWGHTGAGSLALRVEGGTATFEEGPPRDPVQVLSVTSALYAYVLSELSRWIGLGIEDECDALRQELVRSDALAARGN